MQLFKRNFFGKTKRNPGFPGILSESEVDFSMIRTDLALEAAAPAGEQNLPGVRICRTRKHDRILTTVTVLDETGAHAIGKPPGQYITLETDPIGETALTGSEEAMLLGESLSALRPAEGTLLVACLGNAAITPDALGPRTARWVLATRHVAGREQLFRKFRPVAVLAPGVLGQTGIETAGIIRTLAKEIGASAVLAIDALAARDLSRLGRTVQIADCGIAPGAGVGNDRAELSRHTLGIPVVSMGIPTVVDCRTLLHDLGLPAPSGVPGSMVVTPRDVDLLIDRGAHLIGMAVNRAAQPELTPEEIAFLIA